MTTYKDSLALIASIGVGKVFRSVDVCPNVRRYLGAMAGRGYISSTGKGRFVVNDVIERKVRR